MLCPVVSARPLGDPMQWLVTRMQKPSRWGESDMQIHITAVHTGRPLLCPVACAGPQSGLRQWAGTCHACSNVLYQGKK